MCDSVEIQGIVTDVNEDLLSFEVNKTTVFLALRTIKNQTELPAKGAEVKVTSRFFNSNEFRVNSIVVTHTDSVIDCDVSTTTSNTNFARIVADLNLSPTDLLEFAKNHDYLKTFLKLPDGITHSGIILSVLRTLRHTRFELQLISHMKFVDDDVNLYKDFRYYTFGIHGSNWSSDLKEKYLIGSLRVNNSTGNISFTDFEREIVCVLSNNFDAGVENILNCFVLIKDATFITEIYNSGSISVFEYLLVDRNKITKLDINGNFNQNLDNPNGYKKTWCKIISKSLLTAVASNQFFYWLKVLHDGECEVIQCLDSSFIDIYPLLKEDHIYEIFYKHSPLSTFNKEIATCFKLPQAKILPDTHFSPRRKDAPEKILTPLEALNNLKSFNIISFEGTIVLKKFVDRNSSRTRSLSKNPNFGTPGLKTHVLQFQTDFAPLTLYLNNWENIVAPYGLIPDMRVVVRNVMPQSRKYYKSTAMTSFEIVRYEPKIKFETAILCGENWGAPYFFGAGHLIPNGTIIYGKAVSLFVLGLKLHVEKSGDQVVLKPIITLIVQDIAGESKVIGKNETGLLLLRLLLRMNEAAFKKWCQGYDSLTDYSYSKNMDVSNIFFDGNENVPRNVLTHYLKSLETQSFQLHLKCRKMDDEGSQPVYFFLDGRF